MNTIAPSVCDPSRPAGRSSLKSSLDATPESPLRGGSTYSKTSHASEVEHPRSVVWSDFENPLDRIGSNHPLMSKQQVATEIDARDKGTPDDWVSRHPALVRLTGRHPFNCEPPVSMLLDQGFITPVSLHYVRNHGRTPRLTWADHRITIKGLVARPLTLSMDELVNLLPTVSIPVTLVCAGNRRKEVNMIKKTIGFNWGCAGHACNVWTGVRLCDLLEQCGIDRSQARHVAFTGVKSEGLPNGDGTYGTSIDITTAMDQNGDIIIAWEQNGVRLTPDNGFPLRVIIPGWIGGRMVKWLEEIEVMDKPSENYYHFFDNRIMPSHVDAELAKSEGWWYKPEYLFNQLNINSAIVYPQNGEMLSLTGAGVYTIKGYAYSGGGRKVTRVEVSFDGGKTWELCKCNYPEESLSHAPANGKYWCWMFWELTVDKFRFLTLSSGEIRCRAWDEASNTQPKDITWNLTGMGNNCYFTVKVQPKESNGSVALTFLHPTVPGSARGGWMQPPATVPAANGLKPPPKKSLSSPALASIPKTLTMAEVAKHGTEESAWIVIEGRVYDCTSYLKDHPGGAASILLSAGNDATEHFRAIHSDKAKSILEGFYIGDLSEEVGAEQER